MNHFLVKVLITVILLIPSHFSARAEISDVSFAKIEHEGYFFSDVIAFLENLKKYFQVQPNGLLSNYLLCEQQEIFSILKISANEIDKSETIEKCKGDLLDLLILEYVIKRQDIKVNQKSIDLFKEVQKNKKLLLKDSQILNFLKMEIFLRSRIVSKNSDKKDSKHLFNIKRFDDPNIKQDLTGIRNGLRKDVNSSFKF